MNTRAEYYKQYATKNKEKIKLKNQLYYSKNKLIIDAKHKEYYTKNSDIYDNYYTNNKEKILKYKKEYYIKNKNTIVNRCSKYVTDRDKTDKNFQLMRILRNRVRHYIHNPTKTPIKSKTRDLICCTTEHIRTHIEKQFKSDMSWENHGTVWHIDHIIPISFFDITDITEQKLAFHWGNIQPLYINENLSKGDMILKLNFRY